MSVATLNPETARRMVAGKTSRCSFCRQLIQPGDAILWDGTARLSAHTTCEPQADPRPQVSRETVQRRMAEDFEPDTAPIRSQRQIDWQSAIRRAMDDIIEDWAEDLAGVQAGLSGHDFDPFVRGGCHPYCTERHVGALSQEMAVRRAIPGIQGSPEQEAIWDAIANSTDHLVVKALAGTGKSFTCRQAMKLLPGRRMLYLAFNKAIVTEFKADAPDNAEICTLNSIGFRIVKKAFSGVLVDDSKVSNLISELAAPQTPAEHETFRTLSGTVERLVALAQGYLLDGEDPDELQEIADRHELEIDPAVQARAMALVPEVLRLSRERTGVVSYNDQLWLPVVLNLPTPKYDVVFVDEAQDLNKVQHHLVMRLLAPGGRVIVVGDDHQAIYGFRGSDVDSINNFCALLAGTHKPIREMPLTVTRRCPKAVVREAQRYVPSLQALPEASDGVVRSLSSQEAEREYRIGDMVLCRCNAPLLGVAFRCIKRGIKAVVRGRDIGQGLISLIQKLQAADVNDLLLKVDAWAARECAKVAGTKREETATQNIQDRADCVRTMAEDADSVTELCARISTIFAGTEEHAVVLSSIHRAKGLEASRVFWFDPAIEIKCSQPWQQRQESNLRYVAITRAKAELVMVIPEK